MSLPLNLLRYGYYGATLPWRWWYGRQCASQGIAPIMVLFYHRVAERDLNPWTCTPRQFRGHLNWLRRHFDLVSLSEAQQRIRNGVNDRPAVAITFDDGYAENCDQALPWLIAEKIPCTYFVSTRYVFEQLPFPHDVARSQRAAPNTIEQLRYLAEQGIELGAHTRNHVDLGAIQDPDRLYDEVVRGGEELQQAVGQAVRYFAFPFGQISNLNRTVFQQAFDHGYEGVCSAYGGYNWPGDDAFHLQRIHADAELIRLKNWLTVDPRKKDLPRYEYESPDVNRSRASVGAAH